MKKVYTLALLLGICYARTQAQSTFEQVHAIFQAKCTGACHSGATPSGNLDLSGTTADVYNRLVNATPTNPSAVSSGYKRVIPGYPFRSLLMKKVNHGLDPNNDLIVAEGSTMPNNTDTLAKEEIELIRQWIIWGAKDTGVVYNSNLIHNYYSGMGVAENTAPLTPQQEGKQGYQAKFGPIFLAPLQEFDFFQVYNPELPAVEITEMHSKLPDNAHHWALRTITPAGIAAMGVAPVPGNNFNTQIQVYQFTKFMGIWQFTDDLILPQGTAHYQDSAEALLLNLHMHNYSSSQIIAASAYVNFYTEPKGSGNIEMKNGIAPYGNTNPFALQIPSTGTPYTLDMAMTAPGETQYIWNIQAHTHQWGTGYKMYLRNGDGTKGDLIYDGNYNENYTFNQGYYDYSHPAVRTFEPMMQVNMDSGIISEATWVNNTGATIPFSLTTQGEMFVTYWQYTSQLPGTTGIGKTGDDASTLSVYPNPGKGYFTLDYTLKTNAQVKADLYNAMGEKVKNVFTGEQTTGKQRLGLDVTKENLATGAYFIKLSVDGCVTTKQVMVVN